MACFSPWGRTNLRDRAELNSESLMYEPSSFKLKDANVCSPIQTCKLVHMSGIHSHMHASSTNGCAFVYLCVQYYIEYNSTVSLLHVQVVQKQA